MNDAKHRLTWYNLKDFTLKALDRSDMVVFTPDSRVDLVRLKRNLLRNIFTSSLPVP